MSVETVREALEIVLGEKISTDRQSVFEAYRRWSGLAEPEVEEAFEMATGDYTDQPIVGPGPPVPEEPTPPLTVEPA